MTEKLKVYKNEDIFQQLCNCCPITHAKIESFKLDVTLSNGQKQVLRLCRNHLDELGRSISTLNMNEHSDEGFSEKVKVSQEVASEIEAYRTIIDVINKHNPNKYDWKDALVDDARNDRIPSKLPRLQRMRVQMICEILKSGYKIKGT